MSPTVMGICGIVSAALGKEDCTKTTGVSRQTGPCGTILVVVTMTVERVS